MTVTSRIPALARCTPLYLVIAVGSTACMSGHRPVVTAERQVCISDEGTVRACLVADAGEDKNNIPIGDTGCFWFRLKEKPEDKAKQFKREASGRPRQFSFQVVNQCQAKVEVKFDLAQEGSLKFLTKRCEVRRDVGQAAQRDSKQDAYLELHKGWIDTGYDASVQCDSLPYRRKTFGQKLTRGFRLVATGYNDRPITPVEFDPEVVLEKAGDP